MHKKLEAELVSLAHTILQMKNKDDAVALREKARLLYERLSVLTFVDEYLNTTPNATETKEELLSKIEKAIEEKPIEIVEELLQITEVEEKIETVEVVKEEVIEEIIEVSLEEIEVVAEEETNKEELEIESVETKKQLTIEEEFKDSVSVDVTTNLFTKVEKKAVGVKPTLNDKLQANIQVGLNDRIAFVKHLFSHSQADFNRVLSQLNSFKTKTEASNFIKKMVKPDYDWTGKEEYEERFLELVERKFL